MKRIVVGVDGSEGSKRAVQWAAEEARLRDATLELVYVYDPPYVPNMIVGVNIEGLRYAAVEEAEGVLAEAAGEVSDVRVETVALSDTSPANALLAQSKGAEMLVVSARGIGAFQRLLLGSVSTHLANHADVPLAIIRD
ncbi:MAG: universal stress protein [Propionibacterium sp.]|nr:universal stress protein [Propionibacterium sp.]